MQVVTINNILFTLCGMFLVICGAKTYDEGHPTGSFLEPYRHSDYAKYEDFYICQELGLLLLYKTWGSAVRGIHMYRY